MVERPKYPQHARGIRRLVEELGDDPRFPALLIGGSIAKDRERPDSDIDVLLVATEEEFDKRVRTLDIAYYSEAIADYPGGYAEGRIISRRFLVEAAERGSEPTRAAFRGAIVAYSRIPDLEALLARIVVYPEHERADKIAAFFSQLVVLNWFLQEGDAREDRYLRSWAAAEMVLYGARLILAHNRILYPYQKWLMHEVEHASDKPIGFIDLAHRLLEMPSTETAQRFLNCVREFQDWGVPAEEVIPRFALNNEWNWREGRPPLHDW